GKGTRADGGAKRARRDVPLPAAVRALPLRLAVRHPLHGVRPLPDREVGSAVALRDERAAGPRLRRALQLPLPVYGSQLWRGGAEHGGLYLLDRLPPASARIGTGDPVEPEVAEGEERVPARLLL